MSDIITYHDNIKAVIEATFPSLKTVAAYRIGEKLNTPALLYEVEQMDFGQRISNGKTPVNLNVALHCVLSAKTTNVGLQVRSFATMVIDLLKDEYFELPDDCEAPYNIQALPGEFKPGKDGFESFVVTFNQVLYVGDAEFDFSGVAVSEITFTSADGDTTTLTP
ncbi:hypothetical protein P8629_02825 [Hydrogenovibrio sp. 3SP14C1]|uniref:hypothetical protein n=1 Tax=Hydrogenovibrio sp. 3SP14C1 TaxID=3038774 RepID=UPI002417E061|nr:hypothetical protein [Hydrogenovibrio sp. 3SP14C1]MDG4811931.1 hypothetical protein [Hydrogenovibrio sp. 3SP14C1]